MAKVWGQGREIISKLGPGAKGRLRSTGSEDQSPSIALPLSYLTVADKNIPPFGNLGTRVIREISAIYHVPVSTLGWLEQGSALLKHTSREGQWSLG